MTPRVSLALLVLALFSANQPSARAAAQMSNPVPGSTFSSSSVTFNWTAGSATNYALLVGSSLYGHDIYSSGVINGLSATVNNIPTDGRTIYVTLASNVSGSGLPQLYLHSCYFFSYPNTDRDSNANSDAYSYSNSNADGHASSSRSAYCG